MAYSAPDPQQFKGMEEAYSVMAPSAAIAIVLPAFVFGGPVTGIAKIIYFNQCNPGKIMRIGAEWLQLAEKYLTAEEQLQEEIDKLEEGDWEGKDRQAFNDKAHEVKEQLKIIGAYAMITGISLMTIASMLAVMVPLMLAAATTLAALAGVFLALKAIPPPFGIVAQIKYRIAVWALAFAMKAALGALDTAIDVAANALAVLMLGNMGTSFVALAANGNVVNPAETLGSTGFHMLQGLTNMALRDLMGGLGPITTGFSGAQGINNLNGAAEGIANPDAESPEGNGINPMGLDFVPDTFKDQAVGGGDDLPTEFMTPRERQHLEETGTYKSEAELDKEEQAQ